MNDRELDISFGKHRADTNWKVDYLTWDEFVERLRKIRRTSETMAQYDAMDKAKRGNIKDGPAFVGGLVRGGRRRKQNIDSRSLITLDADLISATDDFFFDVELVLGGTAYAIYSTHSSRPTSPRYRVVVLPDRKLSGDEYSAVTRRLTEQIGIGYFDKKSYECQQLMYLPSGSKDADVVLEVFEGEPLSVDDILATYHNWQDVSEWPRHPKDRAAVRATNTKAQDPREKFGTIGLFCRTFSIEEGINEFLSDIYSPGTMAHRYTYALGTSANGLEIYPDQDLAFSHQDSDPTADGRTYNLFDLIRVHKFGHLDERVSDDFTGIRPSQTAMEHFVAQLPEVKKLVQAERDQDFAEMAEAFETKDEDPEEPEGDEWKEKLECHSKTGDILSRPGNIELLLSHGEWRGVLAYDAFGNTEVIRSDLPWRKRERSRQPFEPWLAEDDRRLRHWLGKKYSIKGANIIMDALTEVTRKHRFHPIMEYVESQVWDGIGRVDRLFVDYLGAPDTHYVHQATRKMLVAAIARLYNPGCKFDQMLVLIGPQGAGKSSIIAKLGRKWFSDSLRTFENKEAGEHLQSGWIFEIGELSAMKRSEVEEVKAFLSKTEDRYRVAYDRQVSEFPRKCVFFGTTNTREFLRDATGNRRFWPVDVHPENACLTHWTHMTDGVVGQIWAEALHLFKRGEPLELDKKARDEAELQQETHMEIDPRDGIIQEWLETPVEDEWGDGSEKGVLRMRVCAAQIWVDCLGNKKGAMQPWEAKGIVDSLRRIPRWEERPGKARIKGYGVQKVFERVAGFVSEPVDEG